MEKASDNEIHIRWDFIIFGVGFGLLLSRFFFPYKLEDFLHHRYCSVCFTTTDVARNEAKYTLKKILRTRTQYKEFAETGLTSCRMSNFLIVVWGRSSQGRLGYNTPHKDHRIYVAVLWRTSSASDITWEYCFLFCFFLSFYNFFPWWKPQVDAMLILFLKLQCEVTEV